MQMFSRQGLPFRAHRSGEGIIEPDLNYRRWSLSIKRWKAQKCCPESSVRFGKKKGSWRFSKCPSREAYMPSMERFQLLPVSCKTRSARTFQDPYSKATKLRTTPIASPCICIPSVPRRYCACTYKCPLLTTTGLNSSKSWMLITCSFRRFKQKGMEMLRHLEQVVSTQNSAQTSSKFSLHLEQSIAFRLALTLLLFKSCPSPSSHTCIIIRTSKTNDIRHSSEKLDTPLGLTEVVLF